jgi:NAD(P)-dependent dehydrogenase (short-subunit alcohol dehydrogenase family)
MASTVLVTGANRGIGLALARAFAARGDAVLATARDRRGAAVIDGLRATGDVTSFILDVTDPARAADLAHMLSDRSLDLLVCNAGALIGWGGLDDPAFTPETWTTTLMTNVAGPFFTVRAFLPLLRRAAAPRVAILTSTMGSTARARGDAFPYRASKAAATNLAVNLAVALKPLGVAVGAYHPGWVRTDMGGPRADLSVEESVEGLLARFDALSLATTGAVETLTGEAIPF